MDLGIPVPNSYDLSTCLIEQLGPKWHVLDMSLQLSTSWKTESLNYIISKEKGEIICSWRKPRENRLLFVPAPWTVSWQFDISVHIATCLSFHHWSHTCWLIRRDDERGPRWAPSSALQAVPEMQLAVIQLGSAGSCRLLDETHWSMAVDLYPF